MTATNHDGHSNDGMYLDLSKYGGITSYDITLCVGFFQNNENEVNIVVV